MGREISKALQAHDAVNANKERLPPALRGKTFASQEPRTVLVWEDWLFCCNVILVDLKVVTSTYVKLILVSIKQVST